MESHNRHLAVASLMMSQLFLGINWFNFAAVFPFIAKDMNQNVSALGLITTTFILGAALFQLPGGMIAANVGSKITLLAGLMIASVAALLTGLATGVYVLVILRFFVGLGSGLSFASALSLTARYFQEGSGSLSFGIFTSAGSMGSTAGLLVWGILAETIGWRVSLLISGVLGIAVALLITISIASDRGMAGLNISASAIRRVISERALNEVSVILLAPLIGFTLVGNFVVIYSETILNTSHAVASVVGSLTPVLSGSTALIFGRLYSKVGRAKTTLILSGLATAAGLAIASVNSFYAVVIMVIIVGAGLGVSNIAALMGARESGGGSLAYETVRFGWLNAISMMGSFWPPIVFGYVALDAGFPVAWLSSSLITVRFVVPFLIRGRSKS